MISRYYQLSKQYYYFGMYNIFFPKLEYMNMLFQYEQVNITMYAWAPHGAKYKHVGDTMDQQDSDCEVEVIAFQSAYITSQVISHTSFQEFPIPLDICANSNSPRRYKYTASLQNRANTTEHHWNGTTITDYVPPILKTDDFITTHCKDITKNIKPVYNIGGIQHNHMMVAYHWYAVW
jgi:hypothetical protein